MKVIYKVIKEWSSLSGVHYDDINSADIRDEALAKVFEEWCREKVSYGPLSIYLANSHQGHEKMKAFRNKGWGYLSLMEEIFPEGWATGGMAHCGTAGAPPGAPQVLPLLPPAITPHPTFHPPMLSITHPL